MLRVVTCRQTTRDKVCLFLFQKYLDFAFFHLNFTLLMVSTQRKMWGFILICWNIFKTKYVDSRKQAFLTTCLLFPGCVYPNTLYPFLQFSSKEGKKLLDCSHTRLKQSFWDRVAASCLLKAGKKTDNQGQNFSVCSGPTSCLLFQLPALFISYSSQANQRV